MHLSIIYSLLFTVMLSNAEIQIKDLLGKWQLVYFDGIEKVKNSEQYKSSDTAMRANIEYKIQSRLENTVYDFFSTDSLRYSDYQNNTIVMKKAKIELNKDSVLTIFDGREMREAKIVELDSTKLVLEPISKNSNGGRLIFERIIESKKE